MRAAKIRLRVYKIIAWNKYIKAIPLSSDADYWYEHYKFLADNYDYM